MAQPLISANQRLRLNMQQKRAIRGRCICNAVNNFFMITSHFNETHVTMVSVLLKNDNIYILALSTVCIMSYLHFETCS